MGNVLQIAVVDICREGEFWQAF